MGAPDTTTLTIADNDAPGTFQFSAATYSVWENAGPATVRVTRTGTNLASGITVQFATSQRHRHAPAATIPPCRGRSRSPRSRPSRT